MKINKRSWGVVGAFFMYIAFAGVSNATIYSYTDAAKNIQYSLTVTSSGTNTFDALFNVSAIGTPPANYYASAFTFKFSENDDWNIGGLAGTPSLADPWEIADFDTNLGVKVLNGGTYGALLESNRVGFYDIYVKKDQPLTSVSELQLVSATDQDYAFDLTQYARNDRDAIDPLAELIAFKALYLTKDGTTVTFQGWLSRELKVPEASALMLFGSSLVGLVLYRRRKRLE